MSRYHSDDFLIEERHARIAERLRGIAPPLPDEDEDPNPRFADLTERDKIAAVARYTDKFGRDWVDEAFAGLSREQLLSAYAKGRTVFKDLLLAEFDRFAGELIDRAIHNGGIEP
jgi:hypothetical protein